MLHKKQLNVVSTLNNLNVIGAQGDLDQAFNRNNNNNKVYSSQNGQVRMGVVEGSKNSTSSESSKQNGYSTPMNLSNNNIDSTTDVDLGEGETKMTEATPEEREDLLSTIQITTTREVLNQEQFDRRYEAGERPSVSLRDYCRSCISSCECTPKCVQKKTLSFFPFIKVFKNYSIKDDLLGDAVAGITIGVMQIPQGMAYALLASLPPQYGLYTSLFPVLLYFFFGTSRHVSVGTFAVVSLMVGSTVDKYCGSGSPDGDGEMTTTSYLTTMGLGDNTTSEDGISAEELICKVGVATAVTFLGGIIQLLMFLFRLGFVTNYLSEAMTRGFTTGCAIHVFSSQIKYVFGVSIDRYSGPWKLIYTYRDLILALPETNPAAFILSVIFIVIIFVVKEYLNPPVKKRIKAPIPIDLIMVIIGTIASAFGDFNGRWDIQVVGDIPVGFPAPSFPPVERFGDVFADAITVAIVAFAISVSMVQLFARKHNYETDSNQELLAHGVCNSVSSCFNCYMMCVSLSRSVVQEAIGCKSQITALWSSSLIAIVIIFIAQYFEQLPNCVLAAIIIVALKGMFMQFKDLPEYWKISKVDLSTWLVAFVAVVLLDVGYGLVVGVFYSLLTVVGRTQRPYSTIEHRIDSTDIYKDAGVYSNSEEGKKVKIFRFDNAIYYANCTYFIDQIYEKTGCDAKKISLERAKIEQNMEKAKGKIQKEEGRPSSNGMATMEESIGYQLPEPNVHHVIIDCAAVGYLDAMGVKTLKQVCTEYKEIGVTTFLANCNAGVRHMLEVGNFHEKFEKSILFPTVHDAVVSAVNKQPVQQDELVMTVPKEENTVL